MNDNILDIVWGAVDQINATANEGELIAKEPDTPLLGSDDGIDSLCFVNLIVALEEQIQQKKNKSVLIVSEETLALEEHPFRTVRTLADYLEKLLDD